MSERARLSPREATLRSVATVCLAGAAVVQALALPKLVPDGGQFVVLSLATMAVCLVLSVTLTVAPAGAAHPVWRIVAGAAVMLLVGWALPHAVVVPGLAAARGQWSGMPGALVAGLAGGCLVVAGLAGRPRRPSAGVLAIALAVLVVSAPGVWVLLVSLGPGPVGGEQSLAAAHVHGHVHPVVDEQAIEFRAGTRGGRYVIAVPAPLRRPPLELELVIAAAVVFTSGAVRHLGRRSALHGRLA